MFLMLRRNQKISARRSMLYEANKLAKFIMMLSWGVAIIYMLVLSIGLSFAANSIGRFTAPQFFFSLIPFWVTVDFFARIFFQHTPAQVVKPYLLLPLRKYDCVDCFILASVFSSWNLIWLIITIPFVIMSVVFKYGVLVSLNLVLVFQLLVIVNALFYILYRTLVSYKYNYILLPVSFFALLFSPFLFYGVDGMMQIYSQVGTFIVDASFVVYAVILLFLLLLFWINRKVQYKYIVSEVSSEDNVEVRPMSFFAYFDKLGIIGEYLKIEVKSLYRNKSIRQTFVFQVIFVVILSGVNSFTDIYEDGFSTRFWAIYPFDLLCINLVRIMGVEGNYIECLMVRKENIRNLLEAKYCFNVVLQLLPLVLMLPTVIYGKYSFLMLVSLMLFTVGPMYFLLMQLAVSNKQTFPLNSKLTKKNGLDTNYLEVIFQMIALFFPVLLLYILPLVFGDTISYIILLILGLLFLVFHKFWINSIYKRMMKRKYENLYGFMTSR